MTAVFRFSDHTITNGTQQATALTESEAVILGLLAKHHNRVVSFGTIADSLWPISADSVKNEHNQIAVYVNHLRPKLQPFGLQIKNIHGVGYYLEGELDVDWTAV